MNSNICAPVLSLQEKHIFGWLLHVQLLSGYLLKVGVAVNELFALATVVGCGITAFRYCLAEFVDLTLILHIERY